MSSLNAWIHLVWGTRKRKPFLSNKIRQDVFKHIRENAKTKGIYIDFINGYLDHMHVLISLSPTQNVADVVQLLKGESSHWINQNKLTSEKFQWQRRYWGMAIGLSEVARIRKYISGQEEHHRHKTFREEVEDFIENYGLDPFDDE